MNEPPEMIDNARVLCWAWADEVPFGLCSDIEIFGFAICEYPDGSRYRFSCDRDWEVVNDSQQGDIEEAKAATPANYLSQAHRIQWHAR